jgi:hypothetical protein
MNEIQQTKLEMRIAELEANREELRDAFAMAALTSPHTLVLRIGENANCENWLATSCYRIADARLAARRFSAKSCLEPTCDNPAISGSDFCNAHQLVAGDER